MVKDRATDFGGASKRMVDDAVKHGEQPSKMRPTISIGRQINLKHRLSSTHLWRRKNMMSAKKSLQYMHRAC